MKRFFIIIFVISIGLFYFANCTQPAASTESPDTTPPAAPIITGVTPINTLNPTWTWDISSDVAKVYYQFDTTADEWGVISDMKVKTYSKTVTADDAYVLYVKSQDAAGNFSKITSFAIKVDVTGVTAVISSVESVITNDSPFAVTVTFNDDVKDFVVGDIRLVNATASNFVSVSQKVFTADITPAADGDLSVDIPAGVLTDLAGNANTASNIFKITYDGTPPTVEVTSDILSGSFTNDSTIQLTVIFSEIVDMTADDVTIVNATIETFAKGENEKTYNIKIKPIDQGEVTFEIPVNVLTDDAGNFNTGSNILNFTYDITNVTVELSSVESVITNDSPFAVTVTFNDDVKEFTIEDINLVNATASNFTSVSQKVFTVDITPATDGDLSVDIPAGVLTDLAGNSNGASNVFTITYDGTPPTVEVTTDIEFGAFTNVSPIPLTVTISELTNFTQDDITVVNATITKFQQGFNEMNYKIELTPTDQGEVSLEILANAVTDTAGNGNIASNKFSVIYDTIPPVVKDKILASDIIVIENADYVLNQLNFIDEAVELYENDITSDYDDASNKIILTDLAGNVSEIAGVFDGVDATDGLKYAVETISEVSSDIYMMDGTYDMTPTATSLMVNKAINLYGDYKKTFIDYEGGIDIINVGDISGKATIKDLVVGSSKNMATGITGVGFAVDGNILEVSGLRTLKSGNLLYIKTYNGPLTATSPYVMIPNTTYNFSWFQEIDTAGTGWRKSQHNSNNDQQPYLGGNMTAD